MRKSLHDQNQTTRETEYLLSPYKNGLGRSAALDLRRPEPANNSPSSRPSNAFFKRIPPEVSPPSSAFDPLKETPQLLPDYQDRRTQLIQLIRTNFIPFLFQFEFVYIIHIPISFPWSTASRPSHTPSNPIQSNPTWPNPLVPVDLLDVLHGILLHSLRVGLFGGGVGLDDGFGFGLMIERERSMR